MQQIPIESMHIHPPACRTSQVIALTIIAPTERSSSIKGPYDLLLGVRRPECNRNHKNVASVPTQRVPKPIFTRLHKRLIQNADNEADWGENSDSEDPDDLLRHTVESIFSRKLGLADALEYRRLRFWMKPCVYRFGVSPSLVASDSAEQLEMLNVLVRLDIGRECVPSSTASYCAIKWFDARRATESVQLCLPFNFGSGNERADYLPGGLCICTTDILLRQNMIAFAPESIDV